MSKPLHLAYLRLPTTTLVRVYDLQPALDAGTYITRRALKCPKCKRSVSECRECGEVSLEFEGHMTTLPLLRLWCDDCSRFL